MTALELLDITAGYGTTVVLRDVTLCVPTGSVVALLGPNGAGKTTLLRAASGLLAPLRGTIRMDGEDVTTLPSHALAQRGMCHVPEGRGIFRSLTVRQNIALLAGADEEAALTAAVEAFPVLGRRLAQVAGVLSGGEQQMLALTPACTGRPRLILLDEVSVGLAPQVIDEIFTVLARLATAGASLLMVEQYVSRALELADYVYILNQGEVAFVGEPAELGELDVFATYVGAGG